MEKKGNKRNIQVGRLQERFIALCWNWMGQNQTDKNGLARKVDLPHSRISELLGRSRVLTMYYVSLFIRRGVFTVADIYDNKPETAEEREEWEILKQLEDRELQEAILLALRGTLTRPTLIELLKTHQAKDNSIIKTSSSK